MNAEGHERYSRTADALQLNFTMDLIFTSTQEDPQKSILRWIAKTADFSEISFLNPLQIYD